MKFKILLAASAALIVSPGVASAAVLPFGPQNDVAYSTVVNDWGWTQIYSGDYGASGVSIATMFGSAQTYVMLAGMRKGTGIIDVLAATTLAELQTYTAEDASHLSNGAQWYYNGGSLGFAGATDTINQNSADVNGSSNSGQPFERDRLSWHTSGPSNYGGLPTAVNGGWRSGSNTGLNGSSDWVRIVFTANNVNGAVPEPATWAMMIAGFGLVGGAMRRSARKMNVIYA